MEQYTGILSKLSIPEGTPPEKFLWWYPKIEMTAVAKGHPMKILQCTDDLFFAFLKCGMYIGLQAVCKYVYFLKYK